MNINDINTKDYVEFYNMNDLVKAMARNMIVWSWGAEGWTSIEKKLLKFKVNGHHHKGYVYIGVNGMDLFDVFLVKRTGEIKETLKDIYLEDLIDTIDEKVEKIDAYKR